MEGPSPFEKDTGMSLGVQLTGQFAPSSKMHSFLQAENGQALQEALMALAEGWQVSLRKTSEASIFINFQVHPGIEDLQVQIASDSRVLLRFTSTPAGPGYHLFAVTLIDKLTKEFEIKWNNPEQGDATTYLISRDETALHQAFRDWLQGLAKYVLEHPQSGCVSMSLPHGIRVEAEDYYATPLGPRDEEWIKEIVASPGDHVLDFFSWWYGPQDAMYYQGVALLLGWNFVAWREPHTSKETQVMTGFVVACRQAHALDENIELPREAWGDALGFLGEEEDPATEKPDLIGLLGYRRGLLHFPIAGGWSICLPGDFCQEIDGQSVWRGWNHDHEVKIQVIPLKKEAAIEEVLPRLSHNSPGERFTAESADARMRAVGDLFKGENDRLLFEAEYACGDSVLSLAADVPQGQDDWIRGVWESVRRN
jgi:hypothetical protein